MSIVNKIIIALLLIVFVLPSCKKKAVKKVEGPEVVTVEVVMAVEEKFPVFYSTVGQLASPASVKVIAQVNGILEKVHFKEGDMVKKGELLFSIDDRPYTATVSKAKASITKANSDVDVARSQVQRSRDLVDQKFISAQDFDTLKQAEVSAQSALEVAKQEVDIANIQLGYTRVEAPISGQTGILQVQEGNLAETGSDNFLVSVVQLNPLYVDFMIPASMGGDAKMAVKKDKNIISINSTNDVPGQGKWVKGSLEFIDNQVDSKSSTLKLRGRIDNSAGLLWPGQLVNASITLRVIEKAVVIPSTAIRARESGAFVYVVDKENVAKIRPVELGPRNEDFVAVESGLKVGEKVITAGQIGLRDGSKVKSENPTGSVAKEKTPAKK